MELSAAFKENKRLQIFLITLLILAISSVSLGVVLYVQDLENLQNPRDDTSFQNPYESDTTLTTAQAHGDMLSHGNCSNEGPVTLTNSPMDYDDFAYIIPYGLVTGSHVTPIDHQYFVPTIWNSKRDTYPVYTLADATIVDIQHRYNPPTDEYRIVMMHTCTFFTYFDLVTSLSPDIQAEFDKTQNNNYAVLDIPIGAGQEIGRIGGQTLDFAVWNTEYTLGGFISPSNYEAELWKLHTDDPYKYYAEDILQSLINKNLRTADPIAGKIDHDIPGTIVGNWFLEGTDGYTGAGGGTGSMNYWDGHLSLAPHHVDPTAYIFSIGNYNGSPLQLGFSKLDISPTNITKESGLVRYNLYQTDYVDGNGMYWDRNSLVQGLSIITYENVQAIVLMELISDNQLRVEVFVGGYTGGFTESVRTYER